MTSTTCPAIPPQPSPWPGAEHGSPCPTAILWTDCTYGDEWRCQLAESPFPGAAGVVRITVEGLPRCDDTDTTYVPVLVYGLGPFAYTAHATIDGPEEMIDTGHGLRPLGKVRLHTPVVWS